MKYFTNISLCVSWGNFKLIMHCEQVKEFFFPWVILPLVCAELSFGKHSIYRKRINWFLSVIREHPTNALTILAHLYLLVSVFNSWRTHKETYDLSPWFVTSHENWSPSILMNLSQQKLMYPVELPASPCWPHVAWLANLLHDHFACIWRRRYLHKFCSVHVREFVGTATDRWLRRSVMSISLPLIILI